MTRSRIFGISALSLFAGSAAAYPVNGTYVDGPGCDNHGNQLIIEELGEAPLFPADELISVDATFTNMVACPTSHAGGPSALVIMTNLSGREWTDLYYVGDPGTSFTNVDGFASSAAAPGIEGLAFRIDALGVNRNLIAESMTADGVFEVGETWEFLIQDYANAGGVGPGEMGSLDFAGASAGPVGMGLSSGSIVSLVPAPGTAGLFALGTLVAARRRR